MQKLDKMCEICINLILMRLSLKDIDRVMNVIIFSLGTLTHTNNTVII